MTFKQKINKTQEEWRVVESSTSGQVQLHFAYNILQRILQTKKIFPLIVGIF